MRYTDRVYGKFKITQPVILELINSPSLQRLKNIDQAGYRPLWLKPNLKIGKYDHSRFTHSIGVYLLLNKYQATIEEQIAGLIHDVSHSAFSHCIDYVFKTGSEKEHTYQDNLFESYVKKTEIPGIIKKHGFKLEYILNEKNFPLKEKDLPDLCADRIDYSLRTAIVFEEIDKKEKDYFLENLTVKSNDWVFKNRESAKKYAKFFSKLNKVYLSGLPAAIMFRAVGDCLKYAWRKKYLLKKDFYTTDKVVLNKIKKHLRQDDKLKLLWERMNNKIGVRNNLANYDTQVFCKSRAVDPLFLEKGVIKRLSQVAPNWKDVLKKESQPKQYFLKWDR